MKTVKDYIRTIPDFPEKGIMFRDVTSVIQDADGLKLAIDEMIKKLDGLNFDVIAGAESRGFVFGMPIAYALHKPFVMVRKAGKLPCETVSKTYDLEYGTATIEMHKDSIKPGQKVVLVDDLIATGGTMQAAAELVEELGGEVVKMLFLIELAGLNGRKLLSKYDVDADVVIDFSNAKAVDGVLDYCVDKQVPVVLCTTGLSDEQLAKVEECYKKVAVLKSANMSLGINTLMALLKKAAQVFAPAGFDMEIVEKHHNLKLDAPSGTALALADSINEAMDNEYHYVYDRSQRREKRDPKEIGISAVRGGSIVGEHEVLFCGQDEVIEFKHTAYSKAVFAKGAVEAAKFLKGKGAGHYDMADVIAAK